MELTFFMPFAKGIVTSNVSCMYQLGFILFKFNLFCLQNCKLDKDACEPISCMKVHPYAAERENVRRKEGDLNSLSSILNFGLFFMLLILSLLTKISSISWLSVFDFDPSTDSVLQVTKEDYLSCSKSHPIKEYKDGKTKVELGRPGPFYFLSKADGNCEKGQKLTVIVLSVGHHRHSAPLAAPALAPSLLVSPEPTLSPLAPPPANGAFGVRGGFTGILVGIVSLMGMLLV